VEGVGSSTTGAGGLRGRLLLLEFEVEERGRGTPLSLVYFHCDSNEKCSGEDTKVNDWSSLVVLAGGQG